RRLAHLQDGAGLGALQPLLALRVLQFGPRVIRLVAAPADRVGHVDADRPGREVAGEQLVEDVPERRDSARPDNRAGKAARSEHLRTAEAARLVTRVQANVGKPLVAGVLLVDLRVLDVL